MSTINTASTEKDRNIIIVYLKTDLTFEDIIPLIREYVTKRYEGLFNILNIGIKEQIDDAVGKVKNLFEEVYKAGMTMYSDIHGKLEVDILAYALRPFYIRTGYIESEDKAIVVIKDEDIVRIESMYGKKIIFDSDLMKEVERYANDHIVTEDGDIMLRR